MSKRSPKRTPVRVYVLGQPVTLHRSSGQAYVNVHDPQRRARVRRYLGPMFGPDGELNAETMEKAQRLLSERAATGGAPVELDGDDDLTVAQVLDAFLADRAEFDTEAQLQHFRCAFRPLRELYGSAPAREFGPRALKAVRRRMIESGTLNRWSVNNRVDRIRLAFRWASGSELVPPTVYDALRCVENVRKGRVPGLRESRKVEPVPDEHVEAVLPFLSRQVAAIVEVMRWTGARCGEVVQMRPCDVGREREPWVYTPPTHKTEHHGHARKVYLGPQARAVLGSWLLRAADAPCFSPAEAEVERRAALSEARTAPLSKGNRPGYSERVREGREAVREPGEAYTTASVRRAIHRACDRAEVPRWSPHQLRHAAATRYQHGAGWEEARLLLGHRSVDVTAQYAERDEATAAAAAERLG